LSITGDENAYNDGQWKPSLRAKPPQLRIDRMSTLPSYEGGVSAQAEPDLDSSRKIQENVAKVKFKAADDGAEIWREWSEMEPRCECVCIYWQGVFTNILKVLS
jgi:hypothetical protein